MDENDIVTYKKKDNAILSTLKDLQKKILNIVNAKLSINLTGDEMKLELNNKNIDNLALNLLTDIDFKYLKEIDLSSNLISDISPIKKLRNLKKSIYQII